MIEIGKYVEKAVEWLSLNLAFVFDFITGVVDSIVSGLQAFFNYPHPIVMVLIISFFAYWSRAKKYDGLFDEVFSLKGFKKGFPLTLFSIFGLLLLWGMGFWKATMDTIALILSSAFLALALGVPLGIGAAKNDKVAAIVRPVLDFMQTMPAFVYLIPAILLFNVGNVPGVIATVIFALPPGVRLTNLGIRGVRKDCVEAAEAFGCTGRQLLFKVQIPLAKPTIMAGVNQVIMLSLSMVVIASMVGAGGLGQSVYKGILQAKLDLGFEAGLGIVIVAILLDRVSQSFSQIKK